MSESSRSRSGFWVLIWMLPALLLAVLLLRYAVDLPAGDEWYTPGDLFARLASNEPLTFDDFIAQHNESRTTFPRLIFWGLAELIGWNTRGELALMFVMVCGIALSILKLNRATVADRRWGRIAFALSCLLLFSPAQWENWVYTVQLVVFLSILCIVACLWIAQSSLKFGTRLVLTVVLSTIATYSSASGMLCWAVAFVALFLKDLALRLPPRAPALPNAGSIFRDLSSSLTSLGATPKQSVIGFGLWVAAGAGTALLYFHDYETPAGLPDFQDPLRQPVEAVRFLFALAGSVLGSGSVELSQVVGCVAIILFGVLVIAAWRIDRVRSFEWMIIGFYAVMIDVLITRGRFPHGPPSRYQSFSLYIWISILHLGAIVLPGVISRSTASRFWKRLVLVSTMLFLLLHVSSFAAGAVWIANTSRDHNEGRACLTFVESFQDRRCFSESIKINLDDHILNSIRGANRLGYFEPAIAEKEVDLAVLAGTRSTAGSLDEILLRRHGTSWEYQVSGRLHRCDGCRSADAVLMAWDTPDGTAIPFTAAKTGKRYESFLEVVRGFVQPEEEWSASFQLPIIVGDPERRFAIEESPRITAWSFEADTGEIHPLEGSFPLPLRP